MATTTKKRALRPAYVHVDAEGLALLTERRKAAAAKAVATRKARLAELGGYGATADGKTAGQKAAETRLANEARKAAEIADAERILTWDERVALAKAAAAVKAKKEAEAAARQAQVVARIAVLNDWIKAARAAKAAGFKGQVTEANYIDFLPAATA